MLREFIVQNQRAEDKANILFKKWSLFLANSWTQDTAVPKGLNCNGRCPARVFSKVW